GAGAGQGDYPAARGQHPGGEARRRRHGVRRRTAGRGGARREGKLTMPEPGARVLVVDAEPKVRDTVASLLRQEGYAVESATALADALRQRADRPPDVLLAELRAAAMPLLDDVQRVWPATVCVLLTGAASP